MEANAVFLVILICILYNSVDTYFTSTPRPQEIKEVTKKTKTISTYSQKNTVADITDDISTTSSSPYTRTQPTQKIPLVSSLPVLIDETDIPEKQVVADKDANHTMEDGQTEPTDVTDTESDSTHWYFMVYGNKTFADPIYKNLVLVILGLCLVTTLAFVFILANRMNKSSSSMSKASCLLLISVAVADILTMVFAAAEIAFLYSETNRNNGFLLFDKCESMFILERLSAIPHAASTWFTVVLAIQRYLCVSRPFTAGKYISIKSSCIGLLLISFLTLSLHMCRFFDNTFVAVTFQIQMSSGNVTIETCHNEYARWIEDPRLYESLFAWTRIILAQFFPAVVLICFVYLVVRKLKQTMQATTRMQIDHPKLSSERRQLSMFVSIVALIVFSIEMASGVFLSFNAWSISTGDEVISYDSLKTASISLDLILYSSYFIVFLIYCLMSEDIRRTVISVCFPKNCRKVCHHNNTGRCSCGKKRLDSTELSPSSKKSTSSTSSGNSQDQRM